MTTPAMESNGSTLDVKNGTVLDSDSQFTTQIDKPVQLRLDAVPPQSRDLDPITVHEFFARTVKKSSNLPALVCKRDGIERRWTYQEYYNECVAVAKSLIALGLGRFRGVGILGFNAPEWFFSNFGTIFAGGIATGIYATNSVESCLYIIEHSETQILVVENESQFKKVAQLPLATLNLLAVVQYSGNINKSLIPIFKPELSTKFLNWQEFIKAGLEIPNSKVEERLRDQAPNHCAELIYTSGTTGNPKGAMMSHDNLTWTARNCFNLLTQDYGTHVGVSFLPLSHVAAQVADLYGPIEIAACIHFARPDALKGTLAETMNEVHPTYFFAVPRVWEKMQEKVLKVVSESSVIRKRIFDWALSIGKAAGYEKLQTGHTNNGWQFKMADKLVLSKIRKRLGLANSYINLTAAAPISKETLEFFLSINIQVLEIFGMTESTGPHTVSTQKFDKVLSSGKDMPGVVSVISKPDQGGEGEFLLNGRNIFMGYYKEEAQTKEVFDNEGFLHTGDIAKKDSEGFVYITGRIKELVITAGGENVAHRPIEHRMRQALPELLSNVMLIGDGRKFLSMLMTLKVDMNMDTLAPTSNLTKEAKDFLVRACALPHSLQIETVEQVRAALVEQPRSIACDDEEHTQAMQEFSKNLHSIFRKALDRVNEEAVSNAAKLQRYLVLPREFSIPGGEFGPTLKLKRSFVANLYKAEIDQLYTEAE